MKINNLWGLGVSNRLIIFFAFSLLHSSAFAQAISSIAQNTRVRYDDVEKSVLTWVQDQKKCNSAVLARDEYETKSDYANRVRNQKIRCPPSFQGAEIELPVALRYNADKEEFTLALFPEVQTAETSNRRPDKNIFVSNWLDSRTANCIPKYGSYRDVADKEHICRVEAARFSAKYFSSAALVAGRRGSYDPDRTCVQEALFNSNCVKWEYKGWRLERAVQYAKNIALTANASVDLARKLKVSEASLRFRVVGDLDVTNETEPKFTVDRVYLINRENNEVLIEISSK